MRYIKPNYMSVYCWSVFASAQTGQCHNWGIFWSRMLGDLQNILRGSFVGRLNHQCPFVGIINFLYNWISFVIRNKLRIRRILKSDQDEAFWSLEEDIVPVLLNHINPGQGCTRHQFLNLADVARGQSARIWQQSGGRITCDPFRIQSCHHCTFEPDLCEKASSRDSDMGEHLKARHSKHWHIFKIVSLILCCTVSKHGDPITNIGGCIHSFF